MPCCPPRRALPPNEQSCTIPKAVSAMSIPLRRDSGPSRRSQEPLTGEVLVHPEFPSQILGNQRALAIYLPPEYAQEVNRPYPVFYLHDGQNLFNSAAAAFGVAWEAARAADRLINLGRIRPLIMVG